MVHLAFVSAPGGSLFMEELLAEIATVVESLGGSVSCHRGNIADYVSEDSIAVVIPHEYFLLAGEAAPETLKRTIAFGVEHPGTQSFENSAAIVGRLAHSFEISDASVSEMSRRGVQSERFTLGYSREWDKVPFAQSVRDIDVLHLGTADENRLAMLAPIAADLAGHRTSLLLPPHEWMNRERPDFVIGEKKHGLLQRSRIILNLHREGSSAFEWVRALEAIRFGCVILTAPSTGLAPLVPGEHVLVSRPEAMASVAKAALCDPGGLSQIAAAAYERCRDTLNMDKSALRLMEIAEDIAAQARSYRVPLPASSEGRQCRFSPSEDERPMALWVPCERGLPVDDHLPGNNAKRLRERIRRNRFRQPQAKGASPATATAADVDVICVRRPGDGPLGLTISSLVESGVNFAFHAASDGAGPLTNAHITTRVEFDAQVGRGVARNELLRHGCSPIVLILDSGDEVLGLGLADAITALHADPTLDIAYPMAAIESPPMIVNALVPELRRLRVFPYLGRGYVVRREFLERNNGFGEDVELEDYVDYEFWLRALKTGGRAELLRQVGIRLWRQQIAADALHALDPGATIARLQQATLA